MGERRVSVPAQPEAEKPTPDFGIPDDIKIEWSEQRDDGKRVVTFKLKDPKFDRWSVQFLIPADVATADGVRDRATWGRVYVAPAVVSLRRCAAGD